MKGKWMERELKPDNKKTCQGIWKMSPYLYNLRSTNIVLALLILHRSSRKYSNEQGEKGKGKGGGLIPALGATYRKLGTKITGSLLNPSTVN